MSAAAFQKYQGAARDHDSAFGLHQFHAVAQPGEGAGADAGHLHALCHEACGAAVPDGFGIGRGRAADQDLVGLQSGGEGEGRLQGFRRGCRGEDAVMEAGGFAAAPDDICAGEHGFAYVLAWPDGDAGRDFGIRADDGTGAYGTVFVSSGAVRKLYAAAQHAASYLGSCAQTGIGPYDAALGAGVFCNVYAGIEDGICAYLRAPGDVHAGGYEAGGFYAG